VYQGAMYGGSLTSILINVPGEASSAVTTLDGYQLTKKGKPGIALALSAIGSFIGGTIGFIGLIFLTPYVAQWAFVFGPPEYFALMLFALIATSGLGDKKLIKGLIAMGLGLLISMVGSDSIQGTNRLTFGSIDLMDGIDFVVVAVGVFGLSEVLILIEEKTKKSEEYEGKIPFRELFPTVKQILRNKWSIARGSIIGFLV
ncbi:tripartite tricarboxylate transporter permease, partial [Paenibacillus sp. YK5]